MRYGKVLTLPAARFFWRDTFTSSARTFLRLSSITLAALTGRSSTRKALAALLWLQHWSNPPLGERQIYQKVEERIPIYHHEMKAIPAIIRQEKLAVVLKSGRQHKKRPRRSASASMQPRVMLYFVMYIQPGPMDCGATINSVGLCTLTGAFSLTT